MSSYVDKIPLFVLTLCSVFVIRSLLLRLNEQFDTRELFANFRKVRQTKSITI